MFKKSRLFKIKREDKHRHRGAVKALRVDKLRGVGQVRALLVKNIAKTQAELQFGNKFKERHIEVASHTHLQHYVEGFRAHLGVLARRQVNTGLDAADDIGAEIVETRGGHLEVNGHGNVGALHGLRIAPTSGQIAKDDVLRAKMEGGKHAQAQGLAQTPFAEHTHAEAQALLVGLGHPLVARIGVDVTIVVELEALVVGTDEEAVVETPLVDEGLVLHLALLGIQCRPAHKKEEAGQQQTVDGKTIFQTVHRNKDAEGVFI